MSLTRVRMSPMRAIKILALDPSLRAARPKPRPSFRRRRRPTWPLPRNTAHPRLCPVRGLRPLCRQLRLDLRRNDVQGGHHHGHAGAEPRQVAVCSDAGRNLSVFGFTTPVPYPFGDERTGSLVSDLDAAVQAARANGADVIVAPFPDALGRDAVIQWPGGVNMQLYWHTTAPSYPPLAAVPENRVYVSKDRADDFIRDFVAFSHGAVVSDEPAAPGVEIGRLGEMYRRVRIDPIWQGRGAGHGRAFALALWPRSRRLRSLEHGRNAGQGGRGRGRGAGRAPSVDRRVTAIVLFPGGYIAEIHAARRPEGSGRASNSSAPALEAPSKRFAGRSISI